MGGAPVLARRRVGEPYRQWAEVAPDQWVERKLLRGLKALPAGKASGDASAMLPRKGNGRYTVTGGAARYVLVTWSARDLLTR